MKNKVFGLSLIVTDELTQNCRKIFDDDDDGDVNGMKLCLRAAATNGPTQ
jgi:hypothetical protein